ncbi:UNVERIFIED_CONTAM: F-box/LRR-repeat protein [Sesamum angustifolium]|uniref:F-box/LRR-repeat protein n=1 Tax=Sesamum angustifolium TaxID=2727405 RepID=A0AAW2JFF0_9LAMI
MEKSSDFVVDTYLMDLPNCHLNRRPRFRAPPLQNVACQQHGMFQYQSLETGEKLQEQEGGANASGGLDRLSALPDIICQHILSFLPATDARRTAFVSRRWRYMWYACDSFMFDEREFHGRPPPLLQWHHSRQNFISIEKFKVSMRFVEEVSPCLEKWIAFALERNVKELSIIAEMKDLIAVAEFFHPFRVPYLLPQAVFTTKSIQCLELVFCDLSNVFGSSIQLPFLRNLDLINVRMNDSIFTNILSGSPLLEKINLSLICGLERIHVTGEKLKMLVVFKCLPLEEVIVKASNIESFLFRGKRHSLDKIDISSCRKLKFLWLQRASNLTDDALEKVVSLNPNLEIMILSHCSALKTAVVHSPNLWMFVLFKCKHLALVKIEAPNLRAFEYSGHMTTFSSVVSSPKLDAIVHMDSPEICGRWYAKLKNMCARFDHCRSFWIRCEHDIDLIIPHKLRKSLLPQLQGLRELKIHIKNGTMNLAQLEDGIRWIFPGLKNLYVESDGSMHHFQYAGATGDVGPAWRKCREFIKQENDRF